MQGKAAALPIDAGAISKALERATRPEPVINLIADNHHPAHNGRAPKKPRSIAAYLYPRFGGMPKSGQTFPRFVVWVAAAP